MSEKEIVLPIQEKSEADATPVRKQLYVAPTLKEFGSINKLTHSGGSGSADLLGMQSGTGMN